MIISDPHNIVLNLQLISLVNISKNTAAPAREKLKKNLLSSLLFCLRFKV